MSTPPITDRDPLKGSSRANKPYSPIDTNKDGIISRKEITETVNKHFSARLNNCNSAAYMISDMEIAEPGSVKKLTKGSPKVVRETEQRLSENLAKTVNKEMENPSLPKIYTISKIEKIGASDVKPLIHAAGKILRNCGLTEKDMIVPETSTPETSQYVQNARPKSDQSLER